MSDQAAIDALRDRIAGRARTGEVGIREFDEGMIYSMGAERVVTQKTAGFGANFFLRNVPRVSQPPDHPGIPVVFGNPEDVFEEYRIPAVILKRDGITPALQRWHPGARQYRAPAEGASPVVVTNPYTGQVVEGYDAYEEMTQAVPFDISYSIRVIARNRGGRNQGNPRNQANAVFMYLAGKFQPHGAMFLRDTIGDTRTYSTVTEYGIEDETIDVTERFIGFTLDVTVEAELDINPAEVHLAAIQFPSIQVTLYG